MRSRTFVPMILLAIAILPACSNTVVTQPAPNPSPQVSAGPTVGDSEGGPLRIEGTFRNKIKVTKARGHFGSSPVGQTYSGAMTFTPKCQRGVCKTEVKVTGSSNYSAVARPDADGVYSWRAPGVALQCGASANGVAVEYRPSKRTVTITPAVGSDGTVASISGTVTNEWAATGVKRCPATKVISRISGTKVG